MNCAEWLELRGRLRKHVLINSYEAFEKRMLLSSRKVLLMGGIIVKSPFQKTTAGGEPVFKSSGLNIRIYDCFGFFEVDVNSDDLNKEVRRTMYRLREGDLVFIEGELISQDNRKGYLLKPFNFYSEEEMSFYRWIFPDRYEAHRQEMIKVKESRFEESADYVLQYPCSPWDLVKLFLRPYLSHFKGEDYAWLAVAIHKIYQKTKDSRIAQLVLKYYLIAETPEIKACRNFCGDSVQRRQFFHFYPDLEGVIDWPDL